jgi:ketosteroid isomerase-like protein
LTKEKSMQRWNAVLLIGCTLGCAAKPATDDSNAAAARAAIEQANQTFVKASMAADAKGMVALAADDIVAMSVDGSPDLVGRAAYEADLTKAVAGRTFVLVERRFTTDTVEVHGDYAYEVGRNFAVRQPKNAPAKRDTTESRYITFWRKDKDGTWRATRDFTARITRPKQ